MKKWFIVIAIILVVIFFVVLSFKNKEPQPETVKKENTPVTLQIYQDPSNYFSMLIPSNWTTKRSNPESTFGLNTPSPIPQQAQATEFTSPSGTKLTIQIYNGQPPCPLTIPINSDFAGYPAAFDEGNFWSIPTTDATIVVALANLNTETDKKLVNEILTNFKITNPQSFTCQ